MANKVAWKEFPEINRKIAFTWNVVHLSGSTLGCHCGTISGITAGFGNHYYAANAGKNIQVLDTKLEPPIRYKREQYSSYWVTPPGETRKVLDYLRTQNLKFSDIAGSGNGYDTLIESLSQHPLWVMSDVINYEAPARKPKFAAVFGGSEEITEYEVFGTTADFAQYLIDKKIGYVMASPVIQNPLHRSSHNYSLNRGWFWIPPKHLERAIDVAEVYGEDQFPSRETWLKTIKQDLANYSVPGTPVPEDKEVMNLVLNDGVFPAVERRFARKRDERGRFVAPNINEA